MYSTEEYEKAKYDSFMEGYYKGAKASYDLVYDVVGVVAYLSSILIFVAFELGDGILFKIISLLLAATNYYFLAVYPKKRLKENGILK